MSREAVSLHRVCLAPFAVLLVLLLIPSWVSGQYPPALLTISPTEVQLGDSVNFSYNCPIQLVSWQYAALPFIYAQITVNRVQEYPTSIPPYVSPYLNVAGTLSYTPPTAGTFTVILRCHYFGTAIGLGDFSCASIMCKSGGQFIVDAPPTISSG